MERPAVKDDPENRIRARRILSIVWTSLVAVVLWLAVGFGGGIAEVFTAGNPAVWAVSASPLVPLALWIRARRGRNRSG
jgi:hypothetical protein